MIELKFTREVEWLVKWDTFLVKSQRGSHLILSDWLKSYESYGFDYELGIVLDNHEIVGGFGVIIPKFLFFKFYIIPHGPVYKSGYENHFEVHAQQIKQRAKALGCCYLQLSVPISSNEKIQKHTYQLSETQFLAKLFKKGKLFSYVYSSYGINWIDFKNYTNYQDFLEQLTPKVRRNVRMPYNKKAQATFVKDITIIEKGYHVIIENAKQANYNVREFKEFRDTINNLVDKDLGYFINCEVDNKLKASGFFVQSGGFITNITGGVLREKPDIKLGYMLQWEIIKKSFELGCKGYNISMGGSTGVQDFKSKFGAEAIYYEDPHYYLVLKPAYFKVFKFFDIYLKKYKQKISTVLSKLKS